MLLEICRELVGVSLLCKFRANHEPTNIYKSKADCSARINIAIVEFAMASSKLYSRKTKIMSGGSMTYCVIDIVFGSPDVVLLYRDHRLHMNL